MEMPDSEKNYQVTLDADLSTTHHTRRTQYLLVRRHRDTGEILVVEKRGNAASSVHWLKYEQNPVVIWKDEETGEFRSEDVKETVKDVYEISMDRGIRQVGSRA